MEEHHSTRPPEEAESREAAPDDALAAIEERLERLRDTTRNLVEAIWLDTWPRAGAIVDFGLNSQQHYEALYYGVREGEITIEALDAALGNGEKLTALARSAPSNPHTEIEFRTSWDGLIPKSDTAGEDGGLDSDAERVMLAGRAQALFEEWREDYAARAKETDTQGHWQVWHQAGYPESQLARLLGGAEPIFPDDYVHVADVPAANPEEAVRLTTSGGNIMDGTLRAWERNPEVLAHVFAPRDTDRGDVVVDPAGQAHLVGNQSFSRIGGATRLPSPSEIADHPPEPEADRSNERNSERKR